MRKKRFMILLLVLAMITVMLPTGLPVYAASDPGNYIFDISEGDITVAAGTNANTVKVTYGASQVQDDIPKTSQITIIGTTTTNAVVVNNVTAHITLSDVNIQETVNGLCAFSLLNGGFSDVELTLVGSNILKSGNNAPGLKAGWRATLTIQGTGSLNVTGGQYSAGIGDGNNQSGGNITIVGGTVTAIAGSGGAGIGGGSAANGTYVGKAISISGGTVYAQGTDGGAGIGGGAQSGGHNVDGGTINISGGTVTAKGSMGGAGIGGGGNLSSGGGAGGLINISGGTVTAIADNNGAGIGGGGANSSGGAGGTINISGGTVTATGGLSGGAGIGGGKTGAGGTITIADVATIKTTSANTVQPAIYTASGSLEAASTARVLMANYTTQKVANTNTSVYVKSPFSLHQSFAPTNGYKSIAFTVPSNSTYQLKTAGSLQKHTSGSSSDFDIAGAGLTVFSNVAVDPDEAIVATVKGLIEGATYTMTQIAATDEAAVKAEIEAKITALALNGVATSVTKVLYTPAIAGAAGTPAGTNGTYTFTVDLSKGEVTATSVQKTMTITATAYNSTSQDNIDIEAAKAAIEAKIATLALDGVATFVTKVLYTPAIAGAAGTPAGTNGTYTFTVDLSKGAATATTETLTMTIANLWTDHGNYDLDLYNALVAGTTDNTIEISTPQQLAAVAKAVNDDVETFSGKEVVLAQDIDLSAHNWDPIGHSTSYQGDFDGNEHTVSNMNIMGEYRAAGLFGAVSGQDDEAEHIVIQNVTVDGTISASGEIYAVGGIAGIGSNVEFINCNNGVSISVVAAVMDWGDSDIDTTCVAGIVGLGYKANITDSTNKSNATINVESTSSLVGGIIGLGNESTTISNSVNHGTVVAKDTDGGMESGAGGIAGVKGKGTSIINCYNTGDVSTEGSEWTGGIAGIIVTGGFARTIEPSGDGVVKNCYSIGQLTVDTNGVKGGIAGFGLIDNDDLTDCSYLDSTATYAYYSMDDDMSAGNPITLNGAAKTTEQMKDATYLEELNNWVSNNPLNGVALKTWKQQADVNDGYPSFFNSPSDANTLATVKGLIEGASYTMTQAAAIDEAAVKAMIERVISGLALNGATTWVTKVLYTPATAGAAGTPAGINGTYTFRVGLSKGAATATTATLTMTITATSYVEHSSGGGGSNIPVIQPISGADILVNGDVVQAGTTVDTKVGERTVTTITIDEKKLEQKLMAEGDKATVTIPVKTTSDVIIGELNGQMVKNMEHKQAVVEVKTDVATYTLPAQQINIDAVSGQLGTAVELKDIKVAIEIVKPAQETMKIVENAEKAGQFTIIA
ncbi:beta strand repeat-containing protein, partial [Paenibacillus sp. sgz500958]|uniref:beta strand repeat-containing protein n=1 Tax=Paenibacillus sp. sgz500958 TaxID=3242475 RepID=UPI0036D40AD8